MIRNAFTLIELLVVTAIIAVLISILLPSLGAARRGARTIKCASNLHQVAVGWTLYAQDNRDVVVSGRPAKLDGDNTYFVGNGRKYRPRWFVSLGAAVSIFAFDQPSSEDVHQNVDNPLLVCPEVSGWTSERNSSFGYNFQFLGNTRRTRDKSRYIRFPVLLHAIRGAETVVCADSLGTAAEYPAAKRAAYRRDGSADLMAEGNHGYMLDPPRLTSTSDTCDDNAPGIRGGPHNRHAARTNFAYGDGHVSAQKPESVGYVRAGDGSYLHEGENVHNRLFSGTGRDDDPPSVSP
jgi:prepilin-type N-terminal cleavage/methylation domain-containing protein/prepilin-type processing-associated H-X9-DG protein